jgi:hypothetical protein
MLEIVTNVASAVIVVAEINEYPASRFVTSVLHLKPAEFVESEIKY